MLGFQIVLNKWCYFDRMKKIETSTALFLNKAHIYKYLQHFEIIIDTTTIKLHRHAPERIVCLEVQITMVK